MRGMSTIVDAMSESPPIIDAVLVGRRLRALRGAAGWSVSRLAESSGVSRSMVSEVERGGRVPTILTLDRLATALGTSLVRLLAAEEDGSTRLLRRGEQPVMDEGDWSRRMLNPVLPGVEFEFMRVELRAGADAGTFDPHGAGSREYVAVEAGELTLVVDGEEHVLAAGDSIYFPGRARHGFRNASAAPCVYYLVMDLGSHEGTAAGGPSTDDPARRRGDAA